MKDTNEYLLQLLVWIVTFLFTTSQATDIHIIL